MREYKNPTEIEFPIPPIFQKSDCLLKYNYYKVGKSLLRKVGKLEFGKFEIEKVNELIHFDETFQLYIGFSNIKISYFSITLLLLERFCLICLVHMFYCKVFEEKAGIKENDQILKINDISVAELKDKRILDMLKQTNNDACEIKSKINKLCFKLAKRIFVFTSICQKLKYN